MDAFGRAQPKIIPLELSEDQFQIYNKISRNYSHSFLFESLSGPDVLSESSIMGFDPEMVIRGYSDRIETTSRGGNTITTPTKNPFAKIKDLLGDVNDRSYRYLGGAVGMANYDAARLTEEIPKSHPVREPLMEFGMYDDGIIYDNKKKAPYYFYYEKDRFDELVMSDGMFEKITVSPIRAEIGSEEYEKMVQKAKRYVHDGDVFQAVLSRRFSFEAQGDHLKVYNILRSMNPSPYMYHLKQAEKTVIGASPEMLIRITGDTAETFPIAGTRRISENEEENKRMAKELSQDEKELAEHTMLVDLGRNDIGRVCKYGTVRVRELMRIKRFSHVQHMVTHVSGVLDPAYDMFDAFQAVFPAGTVSGAPKVRAMEIIDELEPHSRGPYAGAVGYFSHNGCCDFAIAIRSAFFEGKRGFVQAGAGIVSDSVPESEFRETEDKAEAIIQALREAAG